METQPQDGHSAIDIIIPFYRNSELVKPLFDSLERVVEELRSSYSVIAVNDSPDDPKLDGELTAAVERMSRELPCHLIRNPRNMGFVKSVNQGLATARKSGHDALLLNSDTLVFPGAISELRRVAYLDPMTGFVSPRTNNATICSLPCQQEFRHVPPAAAYENFLELSRYLPDYHYVPTAVGFCLYIKGEILAEFGLLDESYGWGYDEENDLIMRANRCGYQAALANRAFVYHIGESSFSTSGVALKKLQESSAELLQKRYLEYPAALRAYCNSPHYRGEEMLSAMLPDNEGRLSLVFDFSSVGPYYNGTFEVAKRLLRGAVEHWRHRFTIFVMISNEACKFHELDDLPHVYYVSPDTDRTFAVSLRLGQPFEKSQLERMSRTGVINVFGMLDTIALDCLYLYQTHQTDLATLWGFVCQRADGIIYISDFVRDQFHRRFRVGPGVRELIAYLSLDLHDYASAPHTSGSEHILVVGNAFEHKRVPATVEALSHAFPRVKTVALGCKSVQGQNVIGYPSGELSETRVRNLFANAKFVIFPSLYEGFGIPVLEGLAHKKPVMARSLPVLRAIRDKIDVRDNLILYDSTSDLIARLKEGFPQWRPVTSETNGTEPYNWSAISVNVGAFLESLLQDWSFSDALLPRLEHVALLSERVGGAGAGLMLVRDHEAVVNDIHGSLSWRLTAPLRWVGGVLLRLVASRSVC